MTNQRTIAILLSNANQSIIIECCVGKLYGIHYCLCVNWSVYIKFWRNCIKSTKST